MKFTVVWVPLAEQKLARLWLRASDRSAVSKAAYEIDAFLKTSPLSAGEARSSDQRLLHAAPLAVRYSVSPDDRLVKVVDVWWYPTRA